jgi:hypothetical protein
MTQHRLWMSVFLSLILCSAGAVGASVGHAFDLGASARGLGLGGAFVALVDDETAVVHNAAALGTLTTMGLSSFYVRQFGEVMYGSLCLAMPWMGLSVSLIDSGSIPGTQGAFRYASQAYALSVGVPLGPVGIGVRWRSVHVSAPVAGRGWTLDPAVRVDLGGLQVGAVLESAASAPMTYLSGPQEQFTTSLRLGVAATLSPAPDVLWNAAFEATGLLGPEPGFGAGLEAWMHGLGARVGYDGQGPTVGLTLKVRNAQLDWAYAIRRDLGESHRVSLAFRF